jgi:hypothetical protein
VDVALLQRRSADEPVPDGLRPHGAHPVAPLLHARACAARCAVGADPHPVFAFGSLKKSPSARPHALHSLSPTATLLVVIVAADGIAQNALSYLDRACSDVEIVAISGFALTLLQS